MGKSKENSRFYNAKARNTKVLYYYHPDNIYPVRVCFLREIHRSRDSV